MNSAMAITPPDDGRITRPRSGSNRQVSLYASRIKPGVTPLALDRPNAGRVPRLPDLPPLPASPRWDSLSNGAHLVNRGSTSSRSSPSPYDVPRDPLSHQPMAPPVASPMRAGVGPIPSPRDALTGTPSPRSGSPPVPLTAKSSFADLRLADGGGGGGGGHVLVVVVLMLVRGAVEESGMHGCTKRPAVLPTPRSCSHTTRRITQILYSSSTMWCLSSWISM